MKPTLKPVGLHVEAVDHGDFYKAIRHSLSLANELLGRTTLKDD
jgi:hypothetical protein